MIDIKDRQIIETLEKNAKSSYNNLAQILNISETAVRKRIKKLEEENIILGYKASINYRKLGFSNKIIMGVDVQTKHYFKILNKLNEFDFVKNLSKSSGDHMIMFEVWVKNLDELEKILDKVNSINGVIRSCPSILTSDFEKEVESSSKK